MNLYGCISVLRWNGVLISHWASALWALSICEKLRNALVERMIQYIQMSGKNDLIKSIRVKSSNLTLCSCTAMLFILVTVHILIKVLLTDRYCEILRTVTLHCKVQNWHTLSKSLVWKDFIRRSQLMLAKVFIVHCPLSLPKRRH